MGSSQTTQMAPPAQFQNPVKQTIHNINYWSRPYMIVGLGEALVVGGFSILLILNSSGHPWISFWSIAHSPHILTLIFLAIYIGLRYSSLHKVKKRAPEDVAGRADDTSTLRGFLIAAGLAYAILCITNTGVLVVRIIGFTGSPSSSSNQCVGTACTDTTAVFAFVLNCVAFLAAPLQLLFVVRILIALDKFRKPFAIYTDKEGRQYYGLQSGSAPPPAVGQPIPQQQQIVYQQVPTNTFTTQPGQAYYGHHGNHHKQHFSGAQQQQIPEQNMGDVVANPQPTTNNDTFNVNFDNF